MSFSLALYCQDSSLSFSKSEQQPLPMNCSFATTNLVTPIAERNVFWDICVAILTPWYLFQSMLNVAFDNYASPFGNRAY